MHGMNGRFLFFFFEHAIFFCSRQASMEFTGGALFAHHTWDMISGGIGELRGVIIKIKVFFGINTVVLFDLSY